MIFQVLHVIFPWLRHLEKSSHDQFDWVCATHLALLEYNPLHYTGCHTCYTVAKLNQPSCCIDLHHFNQNFPSHHNPTLHIYVCLNLIEKHIKQKHVINFFLYRTTLTVPPMYSNSCSGSMYCVISLKEQKTVLFRCSSVIHCFTTFQIADKLKINNL